MSHRTKRWLSISVAGVLVAGCIPTRHVFWSPDGKWAAVVGADGLYRCDAGGALSPRLMEKVLVAAWFPDSKKLAVVRQTVAKTWREASAIVSADEKHRMMAAGEELRRDALAYEGEWDKFKPKAAEAFTGGELAAVLLFIRDERSAGLPEKLGARWEPFKSAEANVWSIRVIDGLSDAPGEGETLVRSLSSIWNLSVSSDGKAVAYVEEMPREGMGAGRLKVVASAGGGAAREVAQHVARNFDWSADGKSLAYVRASSPTLEDGSWVLRLGSVSRSTVRGADGSMLGEFSNEDYAGLLFNEEFGAKCLKDGRIVFSTMEASLPCTAKDMPQRVGLFAVDPGKHATVVRLLPREAESRAPDALNYFEISPDEKRAALPGKNGGVSVLNLATGELTVVQEKDSEDKLRSLPMWRSNEELCLSVPSKDGKRSQIGLWTEKGLRVISEAWPDKVVAGVLVKEEAASSQAGK